MTGCYPPNGRRAIITGGAQGLGLEFARRLVDAGAKVCIADIDVTLGEEAAEELREDEIRQIFLKNLLLGQKHCK
jgi:NAD(P)-dependent dehydrogenase (short-subunit alcohol dehydrogenase family)